VETDAPTEQIVICAKCAKIIPEKHTGSFTQWVFRSQTCKCDSPQPVDAVHDRKRKIKTIIKGEDGQPKPSKQYMNLPAETFPIERFKPIRELGAGAGGTVYLCWDENLKRYVSLKVLVHRSSANLIAFQKEAKVTARFQHPNVVNVLDFGITDGGAPYMVLEYVKGIALDQIIRKEGFVPEDVARGLFIQIADALEHGHNEGVFHRDVKSSNIIVGRQSGAEEKIRVIDYGVAALGSDQESTEFQGRTVVGTPKYMSPDQAAGKPYDARSEVYSFGCLMYETLIGRVPFEGASALELLSKHANVPPPPFSEVRADIEIQEEMEDIVQKCLAKDPENRFQNMTTLRKALEKLESESLRKITQRETEEKQTEVEDEVMPPVSTTKWMAIAFAICLLSLIPVMLLIFLPQDAKQLEQTKQKNEKAENLQYKKKVRLNLPDLEPQFAGPKFDFVKTDSGFHQANKRTMLLDEDLAELKGRNDLNAVNIHRTEVEGPGLAYLVNLPLEALDLTETPIRDSALDHVAKMKKLNFLHLQGCLITDAALKKLQGLKLVRLGIGKSELGPEGLRNLSKIKTLETLEIVQTPNIDAEALKILHNFPALKKLAVSADRRLPEAYFKELGTFPKINLQFLGDHISVRNLSHLTSYGLSFRGVKLTKDHMAELKKMTNLTWLELWGIPLTDDLMDDVSELKLTDLSLGLVPISDAGLEKLSKMTSLRWLTIQSTGATDAGIAKLKKTLPKLTIDKLHLQEIDRRRNLD
jgi:serine/threonine protein kinase